MLSRRGPGFIVLALLALALPATALALKLRTQRRTAKPRHIPVSTTSSGVAEIGPLYRSASATNHGCTASVVHSPHGDTLVTAAHCVSGKGAGMVFVPSRHGISHHPDEHTDLEDCINGTNVLLGAALELASER